MKEVKKTNKEESHDETHKETYKETHKEINPNISPITGQPDRPEIVEQHRKMIENQK